MKCAVQTTTPFCPSFRVPMSSNHHSTATMTFLLYPGHSSGAARPPARPRVQPDAVSRRPARPGLLPSLLPQPAERRGRTPGRSPGRFCCRIGRSGRRRLVSQRRHGVPWPELGQVVRASPPGAAGLRRFRSLCGAWHSVFPSTAGACGRRSCCLRWHCDFLLFLLVTISLARTNHPTPCFVAVSVVCSLLSRR